MSFAARYPGRCGGCGETFAAGTEIEYTDDDELIHAGGTCPDPPRTPLDLAPGEQPCPRCRLVHRGECF